MADIPDEVLDGIEAFITTLECQCTCVHLGGGSLRQTCDRCYWLTRLREARRK